MYSRACARKSVLALYEEAIAVRLSSAYPDPEGHILTVVIVTEQRGLIRRHGRERQIELQGTPSIASRCCKIVQTHVARAE